MKRLILVMSFVLFAGQPARAEDPAVLGFDCWISPESRFIIYFIRCLHDRDATPAETGAPDPEAAETLDAIRRLLHAGADTEELDRLVQINADAVQPDFFTTIRIFSYPSEESWLTGQPQRLVEMLCPEDAACRIFVRPD